MRAALLFLLLASCGPSGDPCDEVPRPKWCEPPIRISVPDAGRPDAGPRMETWAETIARCNAACAGFLAGPRHVCYPGGACLCAADLPDGGWSC